MSKTINPSRRKGWKILSAKTYPHNFGILIPCDSGVVWEQQTQGVICHHVAIEGIYIPLNKPNDYEVKTGENSDLLARLRNANYTYKPKEIKKVWNQIKKVMHFDFDEVPNPDPINLPNTQEGMMWIKVNKMEGGWGMGDWIKQFEGMTVILIYPNCD